MRLFVPSVETHRWKTPVPLAKFRFQLYDNPLLKVRNAMLKTGILNPHILSLLASVRHTNTIVISDRGFPFWPKIETVDISLCDDIPTVLDVVHALRTNFVAGKAWMAREFVKVNAPKIQANFSEALRGIKIEYEPHEEFKLRVPHAIGLIRTGDTVQYANIILQSA
jgi:D-ribose pyranase